jgi:hypothetical protein
LRDFPALNTTGDLRRGKQKTEALTIEHVYRNCCIGDVGEGARVVARVVLVGVGDVQKAGGSRAEDVGLHTATHTAHEIYLLFLLKAPTIRILPAATATLSL